MGKWHPALLRPCGTEAARKRHRRYGESCATCWQPRELKPCGTSAARARHARAGETCTACQYWPGKQGRAPEKPCGTEAGYQRHRRAGERPCDGCKAGHASYVHDRRTAA